MTEDEAKTKWCPFVRFSIADDGDTAANRDSKVLSDKDSKHGDLQVRHNARCIASACMAWRSDLPNAVAGYCGLAGKL